MIKTQILLWKTIEGNRSVRVRVRVRFLLFYSEIAPTDPWCNMFRTLIWRKKYGEAMSDEHPLKKSSIFANLLMEKPDNSFAIVKMWKKTLKKKHFQKRIYIFTSKFSLRQFSVPACANQPPGFPVRSKWVISNY